VAPGTTAPVGSVTVPERLALNCAYAAVEKHAVRRRMIRTIDLKFLVHIMPPKKSCTVMRVAKSNDLDRGKLEDHLPVEMRSSKGNQENNLNIQLSSVMCSHITLAPVSVKLPASDTRLSPGAIPCWSHLQELIEDERVHLAAKDAGLPRVGNFPCC
jgi:hypothetical protein